MATWQMCGGPRLIIVVLAMIRAQYGALTDEYDLASQMMSCAVSVPATLVRFLSWFVLSKEDLRMALHKNWSVTRDCGTIVITPYILCTRTTYPARTIRV